MFSLNPFRTEIRLRFSCYDDENVDVDKMIILTSWCQSTWFYIHIKPENVIRKLVFSNSIVFSCLLVLSPEIKQSLFVSKTQITFVKLAGVQSCLASVRKGNELSVYVCNVLCLYGCTFRTRKPLYWFLNWGVNWFIFLYHKLALNIFIIF